MGNVLQSCPNSSISLSQINLKNPNKTCAVDCQYSWTDSSTCSVDCGSGGTKTQTLTITQQPSQYGDACPTTTTQTVSCSVPVPCYSVTLNTSSYIGSATITSNLTPVTWFDANASKPLLNDGKTYYLKNVWIYIYEYTKNEGNENSIYAFNIPNPVNSMFIIQDNNTPTYNNVFNTQTLVTNKSINSSMLQILSNGLSLYGDTPINITIKYRTVIEYFNCPPGQYYDNTTLRCQTCTSGNYCTGNQQLTQCPIGKQSSSGASSISSCICNNNLNYFNPLNSSTSCQYFPRLFNINPVYGVATITFDISNIPTSYRKPTNDFGIVFYNLPEQPQPSSFSFTLNNSTTSYTFNSSGGNGNGYRIIQRVYNQTNFTNATSLTLRYITTTTSSNIRCAFYFENIFNANVAYF